MLFVKIVNWWRRRKWRTMRCSSTCRWSLCLWSCSSGSSHERSQRIPVENRFQQPNFMTKIQKANVVFILKQDVFNKKRAIFLDDKKSGCFKWNLVHVDAVLGAGLDERATPNLSQGLKRQKKEISWQTTFKLKIRMD